jgi:hypothetical protein
MRPIPLTPDAGALVERNVNALARVAIVKALARLDPRCDARNHLRSRWPDDPIAPLVLRAASEPATRAANLALGRTLIADLIATIGSTGAGARLLQAGLQLVFGSAGSIYVPGFEATADKVGFVREGAPIPVHGLTTTGGFLEPRKLAVIVGLTSEMIASSNAETMVIDALVRATSLALDAALFDALPADDVRPAGLRHDIAASTASENTDSDDAMIEDLSTIAGAVSVIGGPIMAVASPERAIKIGLRARRELPLGIVGTPAVAGNDVLAVAVNGLASAVDAAPEIEASKFAGVHMNDTPLPIVGDGRTLATPTSSLWQSDTVGLKLSFDASWALRDARALAWLTATGW